MFPPLPEWDAAHPAIVHFPIGILSLVPLLLIITAIWRSARLPLAVVTLLVMVIGVSAMCVVIESGEAAEHIITNMTEPLHEVIEDHEELAESARLFFAILTICYAVVVVVCGLLRQKLKPFVWEIAHFLMVVACLIGLGILANAAHHGGIIVHHYGVHAPINASHDAHQHDGDAPVDTDGDSGEAHEDDHGG